MTRRFLRWLHGRGLLRRRPVARFGGAVLDPGRDGLSAHATTPDAAGEAAHHGARARTDHTVAEALVHDRAEAERRWDTAGVLADVARSIGGSLNLEEVGRRIVDGVRLLLRADAATLFRLDPDAGTLRVVATSGDMGPSFGPGVLLPPGEGVSGLAVRERRAVTTPDNRGDPDIRMGPELRTLVRLAPSRSAIAVPLVAGDTIVGALSAGDRPGRVFTEEEARILQGFAEHATVALKNAELYAEAERQRREVELVGDLAGALGASLDLETVLRLGVESAQELCRSDMARILLREPGSDVLTLRHRVGPYLPPLESVQMTPGRGLSGQILATGRPIRTARYLEDPAIDQSLAEWVRREGIVTAMGVPVGRGDHIAGVLVVFNHTSRAFTDRDEATLVRLANHAAVAIRNAQLFARESGARRAAEVASAQLELLSRRLEEANETERRAIARELHDQIGQDLTALKLVLEMSSRGPATARESTLREARDLLDELIARVRDLSLDLRPTMLDDLGLGPTLVWYVGRYTRRTGIRVRLNRAGLDRRHPPGVETAAFRIVQEALTNVARHAGVDEATVTLDGDDGRLAVDVEDRGRGFHAARALTSGVTAGLSGMKERTVWLGGHLVVESTPGQGTRVRAELPSPVRVPGLNGDGS